MRKLFCLLAILVWSVAAQAQVAGRYVLGPALEQAAAQVSLGLTTDTIYVSFNVIGDGTYLKSAEFYGVVSGTLNTSISCQLQADAAGVPSGSSLETSAITSSFPTGSGAITFTFAGTTQMTNGATYHFVLKNGSTTPGTNYVTYYWLKNYFGPSMIGATGGKPPYSALTTTDGSAWTVSSVSTVGFLISYATASGGAVTHYDGVPAYNRYLDSTNQAYGTNEVGGQFIVPNYGTALRVVGVALNGYRQATPTGNLSVHLWAGSATPTAPLTIAYTTSYAPGQITTANGVMFFLFSAVQVINPNTIVTVTFFDSATDSSSNCYRAVGFVLFDTGAGALSTLPWGGTAVEAWCTSCTTTPSWNTSTTNIVPVSLLLDPAQPFAAATTGGGTGRVVPQ